MKEEIKTAEPVEMPVEAKIKIDKTPKPEATKSSERNKPVFNEAKKQEKKDKACGQNCKYAYGSTACISCVEFKGE